MIAGINQLQRICRGRVVLGCCLTLLLGCSGIVRSAHAQVQPVSVRVPNQTAWVGQRVPFFVELRANGSFDGTAGFDLPQIPGSLIIKIATPVVSSEVIDDANWFVQTHEFALFSQQAGALTIPEFAVRFAHREGFVGEPSDHQGRVPEFEVEIQRPPGTEKIGFLITTESYQLEQSWDPLPGRANVGDIFKRTITQRATQLSAMALAPASTKVPAGIRLYTSDAETQDEIQRGDFFGNRSETITYLLTQPGLISLPAVTYVWWNPKTKTIESKTLPAAKFDVAAIAVDKKRADSTTSSRTGWVGGVLIVAVSFGLGVLVWRWQTVRRNWHEFLKKLNPPDRVAARGLIKACGRSDVLAAEKFWLSWRATQPAENRLPIELQTSVAEMESHLFSKRKTQTDWRGDRLSTAFRNHLGANQTVSKTANGSVLPPLNP